MRLARAGESADVALTGVDGAGCHAGCVVHPPGFPPHAALVLEARVVVLEVNVPLLRGQQVGMWGMGAAVAV